MGVTIGLIVFYGKELLQKKKPTLMTVLRPIGTTEIELNTSNMFMGFILYSRDKIPITFEKKWFTYYFRGVQKEGLFEVNNSINITAIPKPDIDLCDFEENQHYEECQNHVNSNNDLFIDEPNVLKAINCTSEMLKDYEGLSNETKNNIINDGICVDFKNIALSGSTNMNSTISKIKIEMYYNLTYYYDVPDHIENYLNFLPLTMIMFYQTITYSPDDFEHPFKKSIESVSYSFNKNTYHVLKAEIKAIHSITKTGLVFSSTDIRNETGLGIANFFTADNYYTYYGQRFQPLFDFTLNLNQELSTNIRNYKTNSFLFIL